MDPERAAVIGVDNISASIALGLKAKTNLVEIVGHDADDARVDLAQAQGAFDRVERDVAQACSGADLVIIAVPVAEIRDTFADIAPHLKADCLVTDTAPLKAPVMRWADEYLPEDVSFVGGHPILNPAVAGSTPLGDMEASADLLRGGLYCFTTPADASTEVIDICSGLAGVLGAYPYFIDVTEHDGLQAGAEGLLDLLTVALLQAAIDTPGWQELRKFAGQRFANATKDVDNAYERHGALFLNRENIVRRLDVLIEKLSRLRHLLVSENVEDLEAAFAAAAEGHAEWIKDRRQGMWARADDINAEDLPSPAEQIGQMLFGSLTARLRGESPDRSREE